MLIASTFSLVIRHINFLIPTPIEKITKEETANGTG